MPFIIASAPDYAQEGIIDLAGFGEPFIANADLLPRLKNGWPLNEPDRSLHYGGGEKGYIDYPFYEDQNGGK